MVLILLVLALGLVWLIFKRGDDGEPGVELRYGRASGPGCLGAFGGLAGTSSLVPDDGFDAFVDARRSSDEYTDPSYSYLPWNIHHDTLGCDDTTETGVGIHDDFSEDITDPAQSYLPYNIYHDEDFTTCDDAFSIGISFDDDTFSRGGCGGGFDEW